MKYVALSPPAEDILATSALGDIWKSGGSVKYVALSPPAEEEHILASVLTRVPEKGKTPRVLTRVPEKGKTPPKIDPSLV